MDLNEALLARKTASDDADAQSALWLGRHRKKRERVEPTAVVAQVEEETEVTASPPPEDAVAAGRVAAAAVAASAKRAEMISRLVQHVLETQLGGKHNAVRTLVGSDDHDECEVSALDLLVERAEIQRVALTNRSHVVLLNSSASVASTELSEPVSAPVAKHRCGLHLMNWKVDFGAGYTCRGNREQKRQRLEQGLVACRRKVIEKHVAEAEAQASPSLALYDKTPAGALRDLLACSDDDE